MDAFVRQWESGDLPRASWSHAAHMAVAADYAFHESPEWAFQRMKSGMARRYAIKKNDMATVEASRPGLLHTR